MISSYVTYFFSMKSKKQEAVLKFKEEKYSKLVVLLHGLQGNDSEEKQKMTKEFFEEQYKSWLYCSDDLVKAINKMKKLFDDKQSDEKKEQESDQKVIGNIVLTMRKDLLGKTTLTEKDFKYTDCNF